MDTAAPSAPASAGDAAALGPPAHTTIDPGSDPVLLRDRIAKYQKIAATMKEKIASLDVQVRAKDRQLAELAPFVEQMRASVLSTASGDGGQHGLRVVARVATEAGGGGDDATGAAATIDGAGRRRAWACVADDASGRQEWHTEDALLAAVPGAAGLLAIVEPHAPPSAVAALTARVEAAQDELRRHRVRADALLRQRDAELAAARDAVLAEQNRRIQAAGAAGGGGGGRRGAGGASAAAARLDAADAAADGGSTDDDAGLPSLPRPPRAGGFAVGGARAVGDGAAGLPPSRREGGAWDDDAAGGGGGGGREGELSAQLERLLRGRAAAAEREAALRDALGELRRTVAAQRDEIAALRGETDGDGGGGGAGAPGGGSSVAADVAHAPAAAAGGAPDAATAARLHAAQSSAASAASELSVLQLTHEKLGAEYGAYRKRAVGLMRERDDALRRATEELTHARAKLKAMVAAAAASTGGGGGDGDDGGGISAGILNGGGPFVATPAGRRPPSNSASASASASGSTSAAAPRSAGGGTGGGHAPPLDAPRWAYLRNVLVRYLSTPPGGDGAPLRQSLEPAILAVLGLSPLEVLGVQRARGGHGGAALDAGAGSVAAALSPLGAFWSTATSLLGGGGGGGGRGAGGAPAGAGEGDEPAGAPAGWIRGSPLPRHGSGGSGGDASAGGGRNWSGLGGIT